MKFEKKEVIDGKTVITTSKMRFLFWETITKYEAQREKPKGYWDWLQLPGRTQIPMSVSFQLDAWNRL